MLVNATKKRMQEGQLALGLTITMGAALAGKACALAGFDFVMVDNQHGNFGDDANQAAFDAIALGGAMPAIRVQENNYYTIGRALDRGALGIIVPMVNSVEDAREVVRACKYPPQGGRSFGPFGTEHLGSDYAARINDEVYVAVQIETIRAVERAEEILSVEGIDGCWIGPADLGLSMGVDLNTAEGKRAHSAAIQRVLEICQRLGKVPGIAARSWNAKEFADMGFRYITVGSDMILMSTMCQQVIKDIRG
ncbi:MAG: 2,4-dihydroxyhept-2-ene-1,7-dioic acid aldolase [Chloroflexi bacterium]|nr:2,4-dihydroxyhept-2-ene-1,7-dioic acid aldolase [Chloroflexota bacterium]